MRRGRAASVGAVLAAVLLAGCAGPSPGSSAGSGAEVAASPAPASSTYELPACPDLPHVPPVADGLPDLELPCLGGGPAVRLSDLRGTPTVLNVWAAWCTNCAREMPLLAGAMQRAGDRVRFFGVHYRAAEDYGVAAAADFGVPFASVHDEDGDKVAAALRVKGPPQTFFVTADGVVAGRTIGEITSAAQLDELVERYLGVRL